MSQSLPDGTPHKIFTRAHRQRLLLAYQRSGLTQRAFAQRHNIGYSTLTQWLRQQREQRPAEVQAPTPGLTEVRVEGALGSISPTIEVTNPQGWIVRVPASLPTPTLRNILQVLPC